MSDTPEQTSTNPASPTSPAPSSPQPAPVVSTGAPGTSPQTAAVSPVQNAAATPPTSGGAPKGPPRTIHKKADANQYIHFREQCWLVKNIGALTMNDGNYKERYGKYSLFTPVTGDPFRVVSAFTNLADNSELLSMTPEQVSYLVPTVRIFKIGRIWKTEYERAPLAQTSPEPGSFPTLGGSVRRRNVAEDRLIGEYLFKDHTDMSSKRIKGLQYHTAVPGLRGLGHGATVGLKKFTYEYDGGNPEIARMGVMHVKLEFFFTDVRLLFEPVRPGSSLSYIDLITYKPAAFKYDKKGKSLDTINCGGKDIPLTEFYNEDEFSIKLVFGWEAPRNIPGTRDGRLREALDNSQTTLLLNLLRHTFNFNDDGTVELIIEYIGRQEALASAERSDIFWVPGPLKAKHEEAVENLKDATRHLQGIKESRDNYQDKQRYDKALKGAQAQKDLMKNKQGWVQLNNKRHVYERLMSYMYWNHMIWRTWVRPEDITAYNASTKTFDPSIPASEYVRAADEYEQDRTIVSKMTGTDPTAVGTVDKPDPYTGYSSSVRPDHKPVSGTHHSGAPHKHAQGFAGGDIARLVGSHEETQSKKAQATTADIKASAASLIHNLSTLETFHDAVQDGVNYAIKYFFLGDLIQAALACIAGYDVEEKYDQTKKRKRRKDKINLMLGPVIFLDPINKKKFKRKNLADLPISLSEFIAWFNKDIVGELKESWSFKEFLRDVLAHFFPRIVGEDCSTREDASGISELAKVTMTTFSLPKCTNSTNRPGCIPDPKARRWKPRHFTRFFPDNNKIQIYNLKTLNPSDIQQHLYVYWFAYDRTKDFHGDEKEDREQNSIFHYYMGADRGLVKKIQFKRNDVGGLRAGRVISENCRSLQLREVYDATINLFGNPLVRPGHYIYVTPSPFLGRNSYGRLFGVSGYYYVTKVSGEISPGNFETTMVAWWQQYANAEKGKRKGQTSHGALELDAGIFEKYATVKETKAADTTFSTAIETKNKIQIKLTKNTPTALKGFSVIGKGSLP